MVGVPGTVVVVLSASARVPASAHAGAGTLTAGEKVLAPSVDTATWGALGCRLGATEVRYSERQAT